MTRDQLDAIRDRVDEATARGWSMEAKVLADARGLLAEVERLNAERDAAFRRGVAAMREAAAHKVASYTIKVMDPFGNVGIVVEDPMHILVAEIRAIPNPEDKP